MTALAKGIAHVSFPGGGMFVPARSPYDRQMLVECVADRARSARQVQVLVDGRRWLVHARARPAGQCSECSRLLDWACYSNTAGGAICCLRCAFAEETESVPRQDERQTCVV